MFVLSDKGTCSSTCFMWSPSSSTVLTNTNPNLSNDWFTLIFYVWLTVLFAHAGKSSERIWPVYLSHQENTYGFFWLKTSRIRSHTKVWPKYFWFHQRVNIFYVTSRLCIRCVQQTGKAFDSLNICSFLHQSFETKGVHSAFFFK